MKEEKSEFVQINEISMSFTLHISGKRRKYTQLIPIFCNRLLHFSFFFKETGGRMGERLIDSWLLLFSSLFFSNYIHSNCLREETGYFFLHTHLPNFPIFVYILRSNFIEKIISVVKNSYSGSCSNLGSFQTLVIITAFSSICK